MSTGKTHVTASLVLASAFMVGAIFTSRTEMFECAVGALCGTMVTPDWDVDKTFIGNKLIKSKLGRPVERVFNAWLTPYKKSFKHGQFASHFPVYGTYGRMLYVLLMGVVPFYVPYLIILSLQNYYIVLIYEAEWWVRMLFVSWYTVGLVSSDLIHFTLDKLTKNME